MGRPDTLVPFLIDCISIMFPYSVNVSVIGPSGVRVTSWSLRSSVRCRTTQLNM